MKETYPNHSASLHLQCHSSRSIDARIQRSVIGFRGFIACERRALIYCYAFAAESTNQSQSLLKLLSDLSGIDVGNRKSYVSNQAYCRSTCAQRGFSAPQPNTGASHFILSDYR